MGIQGLGTAPSSVLRGRSLQVLATHAILRIEPGPPACRACGHLFDEQPSSLLLHATPILLFAFLVLTDYTARVTVFINLIKFLFKGTGVTVQWGGHLPCTWLTWV